MVVYLVVIVIIKFKSVFVYLFFREGIVLVVDLGYFKVVSSLVFCDGSVRVSLFCNLNVNFWFLIVVWCLFVFDV